MVVLQLDTGCRLLIPREELQGLEKASEAELAKNEIFAGADIAWTDLDVDHYRPHLREGQDSTERWQQARMQEPTACRVENGFVRVGNVRQPDLQEAGPACPSLHTHLAVSPLDSLPSIPAMLRGSFQES